MKFMKYYKFYLSLCMYYIQADIAFELVMRHHVAQNQIAALTPYSAQKDEIKKWLLKKDPKLSNVHVKTVTESQGNILSLTILYPVTGFATIFIGSEYGIVLLSTVRSKPVYELRLGGEGGEEKKNADIGWIMKNLGFVRDSHQICVGITRCKYGLVIVGKSINKTDSPTRCHMHVNDNTGTINTLQETELCSPTVMSGVGLLSTIKIMVAL